MIGIDHTKASLNVRQVFSFTHAQATTAMIWLKEQPQIAGAVILSTCNRMELWLSVSEADEIESDALICELKQVEKMEYGSFFVCREGKAAVEHLFLMAGGMKSQIVGEDQILTQVKDSFALSRASYCTDKVLEVLFRMAITAGKKVKTQVPIAKANYSAAHQALSCLTQWGYRFKEKKCLVIGNGEMGRLTASALLEAGAHVTVTVRQYRSGIVKIPSGCERINYGERYQVIPHCDVIFSATASPNYTITAAELSGKCGEKEQIYIDLAVPRDIEPEIASCGGVRLFDIDSFYLIGASDQLQQIEQAKALIQEQKEAFFSWYECRELIPRIDMISRQAAADLVWRAGKGIKELSLPSEQQQRLEESIAMAGKKVVEKLMFELRDAVAPELLRESLDAWEGIFQKQ
jgi:glutamyl-tRNA reductase